jgi:hypothetical protein
MDERGHLLTGLLEGFWKCFPTEQADHATTARKTSTNDPGKGATVPCVELCAFTPENNPCKALATGFLGNPPRSGLKHRRTLRSISKHDAFP